MTTTLANALEILRKLVGVEDSGTVSIVVGADGVTISPVLFVVTGGGLTAADLAALAESAKEQ